MGKTRLTIILLAIALTLMSFCSQATQEKDEEEHIENRIAVMETDFGVIKFELYENWTPITTSHFIDLAEEGHYDGVLFHRIVDDFVIQTGDGGGSSTIPLEINENATHVDGAVGMARSEDPDSAEDQFYICDGEQHGLDGDYAVFGIVLEGMDVVREIASVPVYGENNPRPGSIVPLVWKNVGTPKENVYVQTLTIENSTLNETGNPFYISGQSQAGFPVWVVAIVALPCLLIVFMRYRKKIV